MVESKPAVKYLGVMIDSKLSFLEQIRRTVDNATKVVMTLNRLMGNVGEVNQKKTFDGSCPVSLTVWSGIVARFPES